MNQYVLSYTITTGEQGLFDIGNTEVNTAISLDYSLTTNDLEKALGHLRPAWWKLLHCFIRL